MKNKIPSRLKLSYVFSYILIFIVPFLVMSLIFYNNSVKSLRTETELSHTHNLGIVKNMIDIRIKELNKIGAQIAHDYRLSRYTVSKNDERPAAINELSKYKESNSILNDLYLHYHDQDSVFSSRGFMSMETFLTYQTNLEHMDRHSFIDTLKAVKYPQLSTQTNIFGNQPIFMYPLPPGPTQSQGIVLMELRDTFFDDMINNLLGSYEGAVYIFNENNEVVSTYSSKPEAFVDSDLIQKTISKSSTVSELSVDKVNYSIIKVHSQDNNWTFVTALPTSQFFYKVYQFKNLMLSIVAFILLLTLISAVYLALRQYHPIEKMLKVVKDHDHNFQNNNKNELDSLRLSIEAMYEKNENLQIQFTEQEPLMRDHCLYMHLQGEHKAAKQLSDSLSLNLNLNEMYSFVFVTSLSTELLRNIKIEELEASARELLSNTTIYSVELIDDKLIAFIVNGESNHRAEKQDFLNLFLELLRNIEPTALIGVGEAYKGTEHIHRSFIEASAAYEHGYTSEVMGIAYYKEIKGPQETLWLPKDLLLKLTQSYKQGNSKTANESIKSLIAWLQNKHTPLHFVQHMQYDIMNTIIKTLNEIGVVFDLEKIYYLRNNTSLEQLEANLISFTDEICTVISSKKENQKQQLQVDILNYIKNHFTDQDFSLESIAQHFNLSSSYLSRYIKEETHMTFSQYVWELRLEEVKNLLTNTDLPIKDIVSTVGYIDAPNFSRKFKNAVGLTPGQYRNLCAKE